MNWTCFECGAAAEHAHHVIPRSYGGTRTVPLCDVCHSKVHKAELYDLSRLIRRGLAKARAAGKQLGRPPKPRTPAADVPPGISCREAARQWGVSRSTAARWLRHGKPVGMPRALPTVAPVELTPQEISP